MRGTLAVLAAQTWRNSPEIVIDIAKKGELLLKFGRHDTGYFCKDTACIALMINIRVNQGKLYTSWVSNPKERSHLEEWQV